MDSFDVFNDPCITSASACHDHDINQASQYMNSGSIAFISIPYDFYPAEEIKEFYDHMIDIIHIFTDYKIQSMIVDSPNRVNLWVSSIIDRS